MLRERLITAAVLVVILIVLLSLEQRIYFALFCVLASGITLAEWWRISMNPSHTKLGYAVAALMTLGVGVTLYSMLSALPAANSAVQLASDPLLNPTLIFAILSTVVWLFVVPFILKKAQTQVREHILFNSLFGLVTVAATALSLVLFVQYLGPWFLLSYFILIWCADSFAYFGGRYFGGAKLAPAISPGKTRSGAICGVAAATIWLLLSAYISPSSFGGILLANSHFLLVLVAGIVLSLYSIVGDLYESLMKRRAGLKDSSNILPGHGGVWDRLDSALVVTPMTFLLIYAFWLS